MVAGQRKSTTNGRKLFAASVLIDAYSDAASLPGYSDQQLADLAVHAVEEFIATTLIGDFPDMAGSLSTVWWS